MILKPSDLISLIALAIAFVSFLVTLWHRRATEHAKTIAALQGEKETVAYIAFEIGEGNIPRSERRRKAVLPALCVAAVYSRSGRSKIMLYYALRQAMQKYRKDVKAAVDSVQSRYDEFKGVTDLRRAHRRLAKLRAAVFGEQPTSQTEREAQPEPPLVVAAPQVVQPGKGP